MNIINLIFVLMYDQIKEYEYFVIVLIIIISIAEQTIFTIITITYFGFFNKISDRSIGGTYLTALNSLSNLSGTWPAVFIFSSVDYFGYEIVGVVSILYSSLFYYKYSEKIIEFDKLDQKEWKVKLEKVDKVE